VFSLLTIECVLLLFSYYGIAQVAQCFCNAFEQKEHYTCHTMCSLYFNAFIQSLLQCLHFTYYRICSFYCSLTVECVLLLSYYRSLDAIDQKEDDRLTRSTILTIECVLFTYYRICSLYLL